MAGLVLEDAAVVAITDTSVQSTARVFQSTARVLQNTGHSADDSIKHLNLYVLILFVFPHCR